MLVLDGLKKFNSTVWLQIILIGFAAFCYGATIFQYPLADYDEATYAQVTVDTLRSGSWSNLTLSGHNWFEKPPLYIWLSMVAVKVFGAHEFAFRLPSVFASLFCLWLVFLITKELTNSRTAAAVAFLVLLFSPPFFIFAREVRLDSGVIMGMLAALFFFIRGGREEKFLFWIFPSIAVAFLFKSAVVFLIGPVLLIYSYAYGQWRWLLNKYLWQGSVVALVLLIPWHVLQSLRFGMVFWNNYFLHQVYDRAVSTLTGSNNYFDYVGFLWQYYQPWMLVLPLMIFILLLNLSSEEFRLKFSWKKITAPLCAALTIFVAFTLARTHLSTYIMPVFPFLAIFVGLSYFQLSESFKRRDVYILLVVLVIPIIIGGFKSFSTLRELAVPYHYEERTIGQTYATRAGHVGTIYSLDWAYVSAISYYAGNVPVAYLDPRFAGGMILKAPFYLVSNVYARPYFLNEDGTPISGRGNFKELYRGQLLIFMFSDKDLQLPMFNR